MGNPVLAEYLLGNPRRRRRRRHSNPVLAEYLLGNPRRRRRRYRRNPERFSMETLTNPMPLLTEAAAGLGGIYAPITVGNFLMDMLAPTVPMLAQPGLMGSAVRAVVRGTVAWALDQFVISPANIARDTKSAFRVGAAVGIGGSLLMDMLGRPLLIGPGDTAMGPAYAFGGMMATTPVSGTGAYFRRGVRGDLGAYFRRGVGMAPNVAFPRTGVSGVGRTNTMFSPGAQHRLYS